MTTRTPTPDSTRPVLPARMGLTARTALAGAMAGGVLSGGILVAVLSMDGRLSGHGLLHASTALFLAGALAGFLASALLGLAGREPGVSLVEAIPGLAHAALYAIMGLSVAWVVSLWTALSVVAPYFASPAAWALVVVGWIGSALIIQGAVSPVTRSTRNAVRRLVELTRRGDSEAAATA